MSRLVDDGNEMNIRRSPRLSEADADALLSGRKLPGHDDLSEVVRLMRSASTVAAPTPSAALAAVLNDGFDPLSVALAPSASRWGRWGVRTAAAVAAAMSVTLGAATANALPAPLQTAVADLVQAVTPLELPRPAAAPSENSDHDSQTPVEQPSTEPAERAPAPAAPVPPRQTAPADEPDTDAPDADAPNTDAPDTDAPDTDAPDTDAPDADEPDADAPDANDGDTDEPNTNDGDTAQPDTDSGDASSDVELDQDDADAID